MAVAKKVLIVDDHPVLRKLAQLSLAGAGYALYEAEDGPGALEAFEQVRPDLVILDVMLPGALTGFELCERMKATRKDAKILFVTACAQSSDEDAGARSGADGYMSKPFSPTALASRVERLLDGTSACSV